MTALMIKDPPTSATSKAAYFRNSPPACCDPAERNLVKCPDHRRDTLDAVSLQRLRRWAASIRTLRHAERDRVDAVEAATSIRVLSGVTRSPHRHGPAASVELTDVRLRFGVARREAVQHSDPALRRLGHGGMRGERSGDRRTAKYGNEISPSHAMTFLASDSSPATPVRLEPCSRPARIP